MISVTDKYIENLYGMCKVEFPQGVIEQAKKCLLDYLGVTFAGSQITKIKIEKLCENFMEGAGAVSLIGLNKKAGLLEASLINGINSHTAELDDGERYGMFHPGSPLFSALLPVAQKYKINAIQFLKGIVIGYESAIRLARALQPALRDRGFHGTGICGTIGAAIAAGAALEFSKKQLKDTLSASATSASGLLKMIKDSSELKPYHTGNAAQNALNSVLLVKSGFEGPDDVLDGEKGFLSIFSGKYDAEQLNIEKTNPAIMGIYIKPYAACRHCHAPVEAAIKLKEKYNLDFHNIKSINVKTYSLALDGHTHTRITGINSAKMSIPYSVAIALITGKANIKEFTPEYIENENVISLINKINVSSDDSLSVLAPRVRAAIVEITTVNEECFSERIDYPKGEPETPMSDADIEEKFLSLSSFAGNDKIVSENIINYVRNIHTDMDKLLQII